MGKMGPDSEGPQMQTVDEQTHLRVSSHGTSDSYIMERVQFCLSDHRQFGKLVCLHVPLEMENLSP